MEGIPRDHAQALFGGHLAHRDGADPGLERVEIGHPGYRVGLVGQIGPVSPPAPGNC
jgi:hypothetical protein